MEFGLIEVIVELGSFLTVKLHVASNQHCRQLKILFICQFCHGWDGDVHGTDYLIHISTFRIWQLVCGCNVYCIIIKQMKQTAQTTIGQSNCSLPIHMHFPQCVSIVVPWSRKEFSLLNWLHTHVFVMTHEATYVNMKWPAFKFKVK